MGPKVNRKAISLRLSAGNSRRSFLDAADVTAIV